MNFSVKSKKSSFRIFKSASIRWFTEHLSFYDNVGPVCGIDAPRMRNDTEQTCNVLKIGRKAGISRQNKRIGVLGEYIMHSSVT